MTLAALVTLVLEIVALVAVLGTLWFTHRYARREVSAQAAARHKALDAHLKAVSRDAQRALGEARDALADANHVRDDTRAIHQHVNAALSDRRVQRLLDSQE